MSEKQKEYFSAADYAFAASPLEICNEFDRSFAKCLKLITSLNDILPFNQHARIGHQSPHDECLFLDIRQPNGSVNTFLLYQTEVRNFSICHTLLSEFHYYKSIRRFSDIIHSCKTIRNVYGTHEIISGLYK